MTLTAISAAAEILAKAMKALDSLREQSKSSKDIALKENISNLYSDLLDLKAAHIRIEEENAELKRTVARMGEKPAPKIKQVGAVNYYFVGEDGPYCQRCYDSNSKEKRLVMLSPQEDWNGGKRRHCPVCGEFFQETKGQSGPIRLGGRRGPYDWMG